MIRLDLFLLAYLVLALYLVCAGLIVLSLVRRHADRRDSARRAERMELLRGPAEACFLDGAPLPSLSAADRHTLLELALRYSALIRGAEAERILACLDEQGILDEIVSRLHARNEWDRALAAETIGRLRVTRAVPALVEALDDRSEEVRTVAARSLAEIGDERAVPALAKALCDPSRWTLSLVAENLMQMGSAAVPPLLDFVRGDDHNVRVAAVQILGEIRDPTATAVLCDVLRSDESLNLRARAAASLGQLGGPCAEAALVAALKDEKWPVRSQAAKALGSLGAAVAAPLLAEAMPDRHWWVRINCAEALARLGPAGARELAALQESADRYVRDAARAAVEAFAMDPGASPAPSAPSFDRPLPASD